MESALERPRSRDPGEHLQLDRRAALQRHQPSARPRGWSSRSSPAHALDEVDAAVARSLPLQVDLQLLEREAHFCETSFAQRLRRRARVRATCGSIDSSMRFSSSTSRFGQITTRGDLAVDVLAGAYGRVRLVDAHLDHFFTPSAMS